MSELLRRHIREVQDFPKLGILFRDLTPVLESPALFREVIDQLVERHRGSTVDKIAAIEARGFLFGAPLAYALGVGVCLLRKPGKLPRRVAREVYALEYGSDALELHEDAVAPGERLLIVDDLLATGGTAFAAGTLIERLGAQVGGFAFVVELAELGGRARLAPWPVQALVDY